MFSFFSLWESDLCGKSDLFGAHSDLKVEALALCHRSYSQMWEDLRAFQVVQMHSLYELIQLYGFQPLPPAENSSLA